MSPAAVHGVDVGRMHFSHTKDSRARSNSNSNSVPPTSTAPALMPSASSPNLSQDSSPGNAPSGSNENHHHHQLPHLPHTTSSPSLTNSTGQTIAAPNPISSRRNSWFSFSSKFSSSSGNGHTDGQQQSGSPPSLSESPKQQQPPGFLISTLRKLSSPNSTGRFGKGNPVCPTGDCKRVVLNRDSTRERCKISELDGGKLRKVAFCVDVEVAPIIEDTETLEARRVEKRRKRELKILEKEMVISQECRSPNEMLLKKVSESVRREKKDRSREDGKGRGRRLSSISTAPGDVNMTPLLDSEAALVDASQPPPSTTTEGPKTPTTPGRKVNSRPTTDPAKIYKQCCQLRETQQLPIIAEQLVKANGAAVLSLLNISRHKFVLADAVALSDFLALVPIKTLSMEDCGLTDEMVRVVLCGLSAVKAPLPKENGIDGKGVHQKFDATGKDDRKSTRGVIEILSFKNNPKIGRDGWKYISLFIHMSRTLKALDLSRIILPRPPPVHAPSHLAHIGKALIPGKNSPMTDTTAVFSRALGERLVGQGLEELALGYCGLSSDQIQCIFEGIMKGGAKRLSLEGNDITDDGLAVIGRWLKSTHEALESHGLDLSNNNLQEHVDMISVSLHESSPLVALRLSDCNLSPASLSSLLPALAGLPTFKLLDLSNNPLLFSAQPDALPILRKHLPKLLTLRKLQLGNTSMMPDHAIALVEIFPDIPMLAHVDISGNPLLLPAGDSPGHEDDIHANSGGSLEEGAALFTALVAAVKVSKTIVRVDTDEPGPAAGDVIKALSRRVLAYCLRNMEAGACDDWMTDVPLPVPAPISPDSPIPDNDDDDDDDDDDDYHTGEHDEWKEEENFVVGGTGVVKALGVCLGNRPHLGRRSSSHSTGLPTLQRVETAGSFTSFTIEEEEGGEKANEMSKSLLMRARKIKERIQPALRRAAHGQVEEMHYRKLLFLDDTLYRVIRRYEEEYPECRLPLPPTSEEPESHLDSLSSSSETDILQPSVLDIEDEIPVTGLTTEITRPLSRRSSQVSLASRNLENEEGQMHRFGQYIRKGVLCPQTPDHLHGVAGQEVDPAHIARIRRIVDEMAGEEIRHKVASVGGVEKMIEKLSEEGGFYGRVIGGETSGITDEELEKIIRMEYVLHTQDGQRE